MDSQLKQRIIILFAALLLIPVQSLQADITDSISKSFRVVSGGTLTVDSDFGSIDITTNNNGYCE